MVKVKKRILAVLPAACFAVIFIFGYLLFKSNDITKQHVVFVSKGSSGGHIFFNLKKR